MSRFGLASIWCVLAWGCQQDANRSIGEGEAESHWLDQCQADADCGSGLCVCGVCTEECGADDRCEVAERPTCAPVQQMAAVCGEAISACVRECIEPADCGAGDFDCRDGICVQAALPVDRCAGVECDPDSQCIAGVCQPNPPAPVCNEGDEERNECAVGHSDRRCINGQWTEWSACPPALEGDCEAACMRLNRCSIEECVHFRVEEPDDFQADCVELCAGQSSLVSLINSQDECGALVDTLRTVSPDYAEICGPESVTCEGLCGDFARCFTRSCEQQIPGAIYDECLTTCDNFGAEGLHAVGLSTCERSLVFMRESWPNAVAACWPDEPRELGLACEAIELRLAGDPAQNARDVVAQIERIQPLVQAQFDTLRGEIADADFETLRVLAQPLTEGFICEFGCSPVEIDAALDAMEQLATALTQHTPEAAAAREIEACVGELARRLGGIQYGFTAAVCGDEHGTSRAVRGMVEGDAASAADILCVTRNAHDMCQSRYMNANPLSVAGRCPDCTVAFGETTCELPLRDTCGAAGSCLCEALDVAGEQCEFVVFGPRGAIAFGEACGQSETIGQSMTAPFDNRGLGSDVSAGCATMPAVLEPRMCGVPEQNGCDDCVQSPRLTCEPGHAGCEVSIGCEDSRGVYPTSACVGGLCAEGWEPVAVCLDDLPCEPAQDCGINVSCQPVRP